MKINALLSLVTITSLACSSPREDDVPDSTETTQAPGDRTPAKDVPSPTINKSSQLALNIIDGMSEKIGNSAPGFTDKLKEKTLERTNSLGLTLKDLFLASEEEILLEIMQIVSEETSALIESSAELSSDALSDIITLALSEATVDVGAMNSVANEKIMKAVIQGVASVKVDLLDNVSKSISTVLANAGVSTSEIIESVFTVVAEVSPETELSTISSALVSGLTTAGASATEVATQTSAAATEVAIAKYSSDSSLLASVLDEIKSSVETAVTSIVSGDSLASILDSLKDAMDTVVNDAGITLDQVAPTCGAGEELNQNNVCELAVDPCLLNGNIIIDTLDEAVARNMAVFKNEIENPYIDSELRCEGDANFTKPYFAGANFDGMDLKNTDLSTFVLVDGTKKASFSGATIGLEFSGAADSTMTSPVEFSSSCDTEALGLFASTTMTLAEENNYNTIEVYVMCDGETWGYAVDVDTQEYLPLYAVSGEKMQYFNRYAYHEQSATPEAAFVSSFTNFVMDPFDGTKLPNGFSIVSETILTECSDSNCTNAISWP